MVCEKWDRGDYTTCFSLHFTQVRNYFVILRPMLFDILFGRFDGGWGKTSTYGQFTPFIWICSPSYVVQRYECWLAWDWHGET